MKMPLITVVMSVFNGKDYIREAIDSILKQSFSEFEFLITNDGSTDDSPHILEEYKKKDHRIDVIHQCNVGLTESLNRMIKEARGEFIARMDVDDISLPERFEKQINKLRENPGYLGVGCWFRTLYGNSTPCSDVVAPDKPELLKRLLYNGINRYAHGSMMIRKKVFDEFRLSYRFKYCQDLDMWLRISEQGDIGMVEDILYNQCIHSQSISSSLVPRRTALVNLILSLASERERNGKEISDWEEEEREIFRKVKLWTEIETKSYDIFLMARRLLLNGENAKARQLLLSIKNNLNITNNFSASYYISCLPGYLTAPVLKLRERINERRYYIRNFNKL